MKTEGRMLLEESNEASNWAVFTMPLSFAIAPNAVNFQAVPKKKAGKWLISHAITEPSPSLLMELHCFQLLFFLLG